MPKKYIRKTLQLWTEDTMSQAIDKVKSGSSIRSTAKKYGLTEGVSVT